MKKLLWWITLPWFLGVYIACTLFEGLCWLVSAPGAVWSIVKEKLGLIP